MFKVLIAEDEPPIMRMIKSTLESVDSDFKVTECCINGKNAVEKLKNEEVFGIQLCAKESAFMSKELATIKTDIESIAQVNLDDIKLNIDYTELKNRLLDLEIKTLI